MDPERRFMVVYQGGIANVFEVESFNLSDYGRDARRIMQADFRSCEIYAAGLGYMGALVHSVYCNEAGDVTHSHWDDNLDNAPFHADFHPINTAYTQV